MKMFRLLLQLLAARSAFAQSDESVTPNEPVARMNIWSTNADKRVRLMAQQLFDAGVVEGRLDRVDGHLDISAKNIVPDRTESPWYSDESVELSIWKNKGGEPKLMLSASHSGSDWLFMESVIFKIGTNLITLPAKPATDVVENGVFENEVWTVE